MAANFSTLFIMLEIVYKARNCLHFINIICLEMSEFCTAIFENVSSGFQETSDTDKTWKNGQESVVA